MLSAVAACSTRAFGPQDEAAVRQVLDRQRDAWNRGDLAAFMQGYHRSPDIVFTSSAKIRRGWDDSMASYQRRYVDGDASMGVLEFSGVEVTGLGPDAALAMGRFELTQTPQAGRGVFSLVLTRRDDRWGIMHDHSSGAAEPEPEPAPEPRPSRRVAVTIDDLPVASYGSYSSDEARREVVRGLCETITEAELPVTGFVTMNNHALDPVLMEAWLDCGIELGNHTWSHPRLAQVGLPAYLDDLRQGHEALRTLVGDDRPLPFRYPFLHRGFDPGSRQAIAALLTELGSRVAPVTIDAWDWLYAAGHLRAVAEDDVAAAERYRTSWMWNVQEATLEAEHLSRELLGREPPQILLLHANSLNAAELPALLRWLEGRGYAFISLDEALADEAYAQPDPSWSPTGDSWWLRLRRSRSMARGEGPFYDLDPVD
ncbi:MAG: polysaccharide deacetylase family protein [Nannocystaceae bacterium]